VRFVPDPWSDRFCCWVLCVCSFGRLFGVASCCFVPADCLSKAIDASCQLFISALVDFLIAPKSHKKMSFFCFPDQPKWPHLMSLWVCPDLANSVSALLMVSSSNNWCRWSAFTAFRYGMTRHTDPAIFQLSHLKPFSFPYTVFQFFTSSLAAVAKSKPFNR
jgi:hypothetical protein